MKRRLNYLATIPKGVCGGNPALSITSVIPSWQSNTVVAASCCGDVFFLRQGLLGIDGKMDAEKCRAILSGNLFQSAQDLRLRTKVYILMRQQPEAHCQEKTGVALWKLCESSGAAQPESGPEPNRASLERPENGSAPTLPIQPG